MNTKTRIDRFVLENNIDFQQESFVDFTLEILKYLQSNKLGDDLVKE